MYDISCTLSWGSLLCHELRQAFFDSFMQPFLPRICSYFLSHLLDGDLVDWYIHPIHPFNVCIYSAHLQCIEGLQKVPKVRERCFDTTNHSSPNDEYEPHNMQCIWLYTFLFSSRSFINSSRSSSKMYVAKTLYSTRLGYLVSYWTD